MRPEQPRVQSDAADPCGDEAGILACCHVAVRTATAGEQELAGPFAGGPQIVIDRLAGLLAQFKSDRPPSFPLPDSCTIRRVAAAGDILDPDGDDITATKLAVDCQIEHSQIASATLDLWVAAAASRRSAFPCSTALAWARGQHSLDPA